MAWELISTWVSGGFFNASDVTGGTIYAANAYSSPRIRKSTDHGVSWGDLGFSSAGIRAITVAPTGDVFAAANPSGGIYRSSDGGGSWTVVPGTGPLAWYDLSTGSDGVLYGAVYGGYLYRSLDNGASWSQIGSSGSWVSIFESSGMVFAIQYGGAVYVSSNQGTSWGVSGWPNKSWFRGRGGHGMMFVVELYGNAYKSVDGGVTWVDLVAPASNFNSVSLDGSAVLFGKTSGELYRYVTPPPPPPTIYPPSGNYTGTQFAGIVASQGFPRYTTDGSDPTGTSEIFTRGIKIVDGMTIKAVTDLEGVLSAVTTATYSNARAIPTPIPSYRDALIPLLLEQYKGDNP